MKIVIGYAPYQSKKGTPQVSQNRQFNWNKAGTVIYPVVMAELATTLFNLGHEVIWLDGIAERINWDQYLIKLLSEDPRYIIWEVKTPVIKKTWEYVNEVKHILPDCKIVLCGDHVTALPEETYNNCSADKLLIGGDYDDLFLEYIGQQKQLTPLINRRMTRYELYANKNGNFQTPPGTYTQFGRDCVHRREGGCTFCSWTNLYRDYRVKSVERAMAEVEACASLGIKEIFDDTGTFPTGAWLNNFCKELRKFNEGTKHGKITMGCNMRPGILRGEDWKNLKESGFRLVLIGLESGNQKTLDSLNKGYSLREICSSFKEASEAGLDVHGTSMVGFPWETKSDSETTIQFTKDLFKKGHAKTIQATVCVPYPGTKLFKECRDKGWLLTEDWDRYDQAEAVMRVEGYDPVKMVKGIYSSCITPSYLIRTIMKEKPSTLLRYAGYLINHLR